MARLTVLSIVVALVLLSTLLERYAAPTSTPPTPVEEFTQPPTPHPASGATRRFTVGEPIAPLELKTSNGSNYLVKLESAQNGTNVLDIYVQGGTNITVKVPVGSYILKYAAGETWYGYDYLFGPDTVYTSAETIFDFHDNGYQISGFTVVLYRVPQGNLLTRAISANDF